MNGFSISITPDNNMIAVALGAAERYCSLYYDDPHTVSRIVLALEEAIAYAIRFTLEGSREDITVSAGEDGAYLSFTVQDNGLPGDFAESLAGEESLGLTLMKGVMDSISVENLGAKGRRQVLKKRICAPQLAPQEAPEEMLQEDAQTHTFSFAPLRREDGWEIARSLYREYGFSYSDETVYYPDKYYDEVQDGHYTAVTAIADGREFAAHVAMSEWGSMPGLSELKMLIVQEKFRCCHLATDISRALIEEAKRQGRARTLFVCADTRHLYSQKAFAKLGGGVCGFSLNCLPPESVSTFSGERERTSMCLMFLPLRDEQQTVYFPQELVGIAQSIYASCGFMRAVAADDEPLPTTGATESAVLVLEGIQLADLTVYEPGKDVLHVLRSADRQFKARATDTAHLFLPVNKPGCARLYEAAQKEGYFFTGIFPGTERGDFLYMTKLFRYLAGYDNMKCIDAARELLETVRTFDGCEKR